MVSKLIRELKELGRLIGWYESGSNLIAFELNRINYLEGQAEGIIHAIDILCGDQPGRLIDGAASRARKTYKRARAQGAEERRLKDATEEEKAA